MFALLRRIGLTTFTAVLLVTIAAAAAPLPVNDPEWGDRRLSGWLQQLKTGDAASRIAAARVIAMILNINHHGCGGVVFLKPGEKLPSYGRAGVADVPYVVPALIEALDDPEPDVQRGAAAALSECGPFAEPAVQGLTAVVRRIRATEAIIALGKLGVAAEPALPELRLALGDKQARIEAAKAIWLIGHEASALTVLIENIPSATEGLADLPRFFELEVGPAAQPAIPLLLNMLTADHGPHSGKRYAAIFILGTIGPAAREAVPALLAAYEQEPTSDSWGPLWITIFETLGKIGPDAKSALPRVLGTLDSPPENRFDRPRVCEAAIKALGGIGPQSPEVIPTLLNAFELNYQGQHHAATDALYRLGPDAKDAVPKLIELLQKNMWASDVNRVLRGIGPAAKDAVPAMMQCFDKSDTNTRFSILEALQAMGSSAGAAVPRLVEALKDPGLKHSPEEMFAVRALWRIDQNPAALEAALDALKSKERWRQWPIPVLGEMGPKAHAALVPLREKLNADDAQVRVGAAEAIWRISGDPEMVRLSEGMLRGDDQLAAVLAAEALWKIDRRPEAIKMLERSAYRTKWPVPGRATSILKQIKSENKVAAN